jgi:hypothetical protein
VHGAIGFTREHDLRLWTTRLWSWRDEDGSDAEWSADLGATVLAAGPDGLWPLITGRAERLGARRHQEAVLSLAHDRRIGAFPDGMRRVSRRSNDHAPSSRPLSGVISASSTPELSQPP